MITIHFSQPHSTKAGEPLSTIRYKVVIGQHNQHQAATIDTQCCWLALEINITSVRDSTLLQEHIKRL